MIQQETRSGQLERLARDEILELIRQRPQTTRTELTQLSGISKGTVSSIVNMLIRKGLLRETGKQQSERGRSQIMLEFDPQARLVLGAELGEHMCTVILADLNASPIATLVVPTRGITPEDFCLTIGEAVEELCQRAAVPILSLGLGVPGTLDPKGRCVNSWASGGWHNVPIADLLEARIGIPVLAANRARVAALGEKWHGSARGINNLAYVFLGNGIVVGLLINGTLYSGNGGAGQLDHMTIVPDGPLCDCGNRGCLHTFAAGHAMINLARSKARLVSDTLLYSMADHDLHHLTFEMLIEAARQGDPVARETVVEASTYTGIAVASLYTLFDPQAVIIGGPVAELGHLILDPIVREARKRVWPIALNDLNIRLSTLGKEAGAIGAAALCLEALVSVTDVLAADGKHGWA
jgi:glucokinase-like ROK family protein